MESSLITDFENILAGYTVDAEGLEADTPSNDQQIKKLKKKLRKHIVDPKVDDLTVSYDKLNKILEGLNKSYEGATKARSNFTSTRENKDTLLIELNKEIEHKKRLELLHAQFMKRYNDEVKAAHDYEAEETEGKKKYSEGLQNKIKIIQDQFEESGKRKIESIRQNQMAKQQLSRLTSHLTASEALVDAQLKKKGLEIDIQMSTLKQKVDMIQGLKTHGADSNQKLQKAKADEGKIDTRLKLFEKKEEEHKMTITRVHLLIQQYKQCVYQIREQLQKLTRESQKLIQKCKKSEQALKSSKDQQIKLKAQRDTQIAQLEGLQKLENSLRDQLKNI